MKFAHIAHTPVTNILIQLMVANNVTKHEQLPSPMRSRTYMNTVCLHLQVQYSNVNMETSMRTHLLEAENANYNYNYNMFDAQLQLQHVRRKGQGLTAYICGHAYSTW